jgi:hypothetical protein
MTYQEWLSEYKFLQSKIDRYKWKGTSGGCRKQVRTRANWDQKQYELMDAYPEHLGRLEEARIWLNYPERKDRIKIRLIRLKNEISINEMVAA